jgi:putative transposase
MRKARFMEEQLVAIIREGDRKSVAAVAKQHGISEQTIYTWRKRFGGSRRTKCGASSSSRPIMFG